MRTITISGEEEPRPCRRFVLTVDVFKNPSLEGLALENLDPEAFLAELFDTWNNPGDGEPWALAQQVSIEEVQ